MRYLLLLSLIAVFLSGCGLAPPRSKPDFGTEYRRFSAPLNEDLNVDIGDHMFVEGEVAYVPVLSMSSGIESMMPGAYGVPFSFSIGKTDLALSYTRGKHSFFCAPEDERHASFPGLGTVVATGDCIGVRRSESTGNLDWVVDNSIHNSSTTVWSRAVKESDGVTFTAGKRRIDDPRRDLEAIYFQGYYSGLLHFKYQELEDGTARVEEFKFDYPPKAGHPVYGVRGKVFEVVEVDNTQLVYRWVSIPNS